MINFHLQNKKEIYIYLYINYNNSKIYIYKQILLYIFFLHNID